MTQHRNSTGARRHFVNLATQRPEAEFKDQTDAQCRSGTDGE
ncbi:hypothetical protein ACFV8Z_41635 [Streptomyces sp. NPDC059837]|nr:MULTISPECIES: hypothetical protein [unclassified Streptomyces]MCX4404991.1 hypothetical protein [Streptomyces sp. NBC_01764]MCX5095639.1 hypothetical protein [Streptomyces sp. NBC_00365]MCX5190465.1 hypothetical protein [Streptomyces sp. NBC_00268]